MLTPALHSRKRWRGLKPETRTGIVVGIVTAAFAAFAVAAHLWWL